MTRETVRRVTEWGIWAGVFIACVPLLMYGFGNTRQWTLREQWAQAHAEASSTGGAESTPDAGRDATDDGLVRIRIPKIHVDAMVVGDVTKNALAEGPGHFPDSALPGDPGNCIIAAHRNVWGCWFANLDQLQTGDRVALETLAHHYYYTVTGKETVSPDNTGVLRNHGKKKELTLITCTLPPTHRIIVHGVLDSQSSG